MGNAHLGSIKACFLKKEDKVAYKEEYERFKYIFTIVSLVFAFTNLFIVNSRLRALGASSSSQMRITVEGFQGWMWRGLTFIIPFLLVIYSLELYNAYILYHLSFHPKCKEWQVPVVGVLFFFLGSGNYLALFRVVWKKFRTNKDFGLNTKYKAS